MAKLVVRRGGSGRSVRKDVLVRIQFWALKRMTRSLSWLGLFYYRLNWMAKLVVRRGGSGRSVRKDVLVRIQFWALKRMTRSLSWLGLFLLSH